ncbi:MAG: restriction endonuclease subunit S [Chitinophagaceae bacterium]
MKQTEIGLIPDDWDYVPINKLVLKTQQRDPSKKPNEKIKYVDVSGVDNTLFEVKEYSTFNGKDAPSRARKVIETNDIIFATVRPTLKRVAIIKSELNDELCSTGYCVLKTDSTKADFRFLYFFLLTEFYIKQIGSLQRGASYPAVRDSDVRGIKIPLPSVKEQQSISYILTLIQTAIQKQEELIRTATELKNALMQKLFTEGIKNKKQKQTEIGLVPQSWEVVKLEEVITQIDYGTSVKCSYEETTTYPVLRIPNIIKGSIDISDLKFGKLNQNEIDKLILSFGDLLFVRTNGVKENAGRCAMYKDEMKQCYFASYLIRIKVKRDFLMPAFFNLYARTETGQRFLSGKAMRTADGKFNINTGTIKSVLVPIPDIKEQEEITLSIESLLRKITNHQTRKQTLTQLFQSMLQQLMTGEIRVKDISFGKEYSIKEEKLSIAAEP